MTDRPILFSGPMVRALLDGSKTQTRRVVKPQPPPDWLPIVGDFCPSLTDRRTGEQFPGDLIFGASDENFGLKSPYGQAGDRLWVRETWRTFKVVDNAKPRNIPPGALVQFQADMSSTVTLPDGGQWGKWRPSIFMPRWASRLSPETAVVRVQRLQDITEEDAEAEGVGFLRKIPDADETLTARQLYEIVWDHLNAKRGYGWKVNPWVWAITFKRITP